MTLSHFGGLVLLRSKNVYTATYAYEDWYKFYGAVFKKVGSDSAVIGMNYSPASYHPYALSTLKHQLIVLNKNVHGLPETIRASPETENMIAIQTR